MADESVRKPATPPSDQKPAAAPAAPPVVTPAKPTAPAVAVVPPATTPQPAATPAPVTPTEPAPAVAPAAAPAPVDFATLRTQQVERLTTAYQFSPEDVRMLQVEPEKVLPKMAAQLHVDVFEATFNALVNALPRLMDSHAQARTARESAETEFFGEFPTLRDPKYRSAVETALMVYRQLNPTATRAQAIAASGVQVSLAHQVPLPEKYLQGFVAGNAVPPATPAPFSPASPGASATPPPGGPTDYFAKIAEEDIAEGR